MGSTGNYYKKKSKEWFEERGYNAEYIERVHTIFKGDKIIYCKRDLFASDVLAVSGDKIVFAQVKKGKQGIASAVRKFKKIDFPKCDHIERWIMIWIPYKKVEIKKI